MSEVPCALCLIETLHRMYSLWHAIHDIQRIGMQLRRQSKYPISDSALKACRAQRKPQHSHFANLLKLYASGYAAEQ
ncbi:hypothetical protein O3297_19085 [Janthinobacterium sp. SUN128]|uniref:Transposase n=1 Tax=Janthinobacterium lividum TaxID=29581 RepID=A0ABU0XWC2_9BURK|nr:MULTISPECIES: hypothetical protein [Janthinobacterium]MDO8035526.1 hypothetical protein [Janthinobacterium sp. SUN128]MDQ4626721.1 hypothetical protein [Janthinobacterium lividum]MDQ4674312.1 hypothetical protein [Janthinobacterium lividum]MDQ4685043.1 hypothetical protein [Janthinobacterium lividum]